MHPNQVEAECPEEVECAEAEVVLDVAAEVLQEAEVVDFEEDEVRLVVAEERQEVEDGKKMCVVCMMIKTSLLGP